MNHEGMQNPAPIQVHLVALPLVAWGLQSLLEGANAGIEVVGRSGSIGESLTELRLSAPHVVVVVDLDSEDSLDALTELSSRGQTHVLVISGSTHAVCHDNAILAGARGVVSKRETPAALLKAIEKVHAGEVWLDRDATGRIFMQLVHGKASQSHDPIQDKIGSLTRRERQTVAALASDAAAPGKVIADRLNMSEHTLRNHLTSIYGKLGLTNRVDLYAFAHRHGLIDPSMLAA